MDVYPYLDQLFAYRRVQTPQAFTFDLDLLSLEHHRNLIFHVSSTHSTPTILTSMCPYVARYRAIRRFHIKQAVSASVSSASTPSMKLLFSSSTSIMCLFLPVSHANLATSSRRCRTSTYRRNTCPLSRHSDMSQCRRSLHEGDTSFFDHRKRACALSHLTFDSTRRRTLPFSKRQPTVLHTHNVSSHMRTLRVLPLVFLTSPQGHAAPQDKFLPGNNAIIAQRNRDTLSSCIRL